MSTRSCTFFLFKILMLIVFFSGPSQAVFSRFYDLYILYVILYINYYVVAATTRVSSMLQWLKKYLFQELFIIID